MKITDTSTLRLTYFADRIIISKEQLIAGSACHHKKEIMLKNRSTIYNGFMSPATRRKVRTILTTWFNAVQHENHENDMVLARSPRKLIFITVTLSDAQKHDDKWIKRNMLDRYLVKLQRKFGVQYYFWKAEKQKNGRIHFHIIVDRYISKESIQSEWNEIQRDTGYMDDYFFKNRRYNAPSTQVRQVSPGQKGIDYVLKYVSKNPEDIEDAELQIQGRIWGCSSELKDLKPYSTGEISEIGVYLNKAALNKEINYFDHDHFQVFYLDVESMLKKRFNSLYMQMHRYYLDVFKFLYVQKPEDKRVTETNKYGVVQKSTMPTQLSLFADMYLDSIGAKRRRSREQH